MKEKRKKSGMSLFFNHGKKSNLLSVSNIRYDNDVLLRGVEGGEHTFSTIRERERGGMERGRESEEGEIIQ